MFFQFLYWFLKFCQDDKHLKISILVWTVTVFKLGNNATSHSRLGSALRRTGRGVLITMGSVWGDKSHEREGFTPVMFVAGLWSLWERLTSTQFGSTVAMFLSARVVARSSRQTKASTDTRSFFFIAIHNTGRVFCNFFMWSKGVGEEKDCSLHIQKKDRHPLSSRLEIFYLVFNLKKNL